VNRSRILHALLLLLAAPGVGNACTVCMGAPESNVAGPVNGAIFLMLGVLTVVGGSFFAFLVYLARCERRPVPPHRDPANLILSESHQND
jgi:hypothetical protein